MWWRQHLQFGGRSFRQRRFGSEKRSSHHNSKIFTNNARIKESPNIFTNNARIKANIITINPRIRLASKYRATQATTETVRTIITGPECYIHLWAVACSGLWILSANSYESLSLDALTIPPSLSFINFLGIYVVPHRHDFKPRPPHPLPLFFLFFSFLSCVWDQLKDEEFARESAQWLKWGFGCIRRYVQIYHLHVLTYYSQYYCILLARSVSNSPVLLETRLKDIHTRRTAASVSIYTLRCLSTEGEYACVGSLPTLPVETFDGSHFRLQDKWYTTK